MKFSTIFSMAALAVSAIAAPLVDGVTQVAEPVKNNGLTDAVPALPVPGSPVKREITDGAGFVKVLGGLVQTVKVETKQINATIVEVKQGTITKEEGETKVTKHFSAIHTSFTKVVTTINASVDIKIGKDLVQQVVALVLALLSEIICTVKSVVAVLGLRAHLREILLAVFHIVASLLALVVRIVGTLAPGLGAALAVILAGLAQGVLAPILAPVFGLLNGLGLL